MNLWVAALLCSHSCNMDNIFLENSSISTEVKKVKSKSYITFFRVSSSKHIIEGSDYFSIVSTKVLMKYFVILMAPYLLLVLIAETKLGKHLHASSLTSSFRCYLIILQRRETVSSTQGLYNYLSCSMKTFNMLIATSASSVSKVLMACYLSYLSSFYYSTTGSGLFTKLSSVLITFLTNSKSEGRILSRQEAN